MWRTGIVAAMALTAGAARAQSINLDMVSRGGIPSVGYAAAGRAGVWNSFDLYDGTMGVRDLNGGPTGVTVTVTNGPTHNQLLSDIMSGDDGALLEDWLSGPQGPAPITVRFDGLAPGSYRVLTYVWSAWNGEPPYRPRVRVDESADPAQLCGLPWVGHHVLGGTYTEHLAVATDGRVTIRIDEPLGRLRVVNGVQLVMVPGPSAAVALGFMGAVGGRRRRVSLG
jgi:hypothetical protein